MRIEELWQLLLVFAPLSLLSIGGGQSIVADIQHQVTTVHQWLSPGQFLDDYAIARASAGPASLIVTLIGWQVAGVAGAIVSSLAIFVPSSALFYGLTILWHRHAFRRWRDRLARGLAPIAVGLVLASGYGLLQANAGDWLSWVVTAASLAVFMRSAAHPFLLIGAGAAIYFVRSLALP